MSVISVADWSAGNGKCIGDIVWTGLWGQSNTLCWVYTLLSPLFSSISSPQWRFNWRVW
ncbi:hypothetical protein RDI58_018834 [Solanum bulbocastanum]|uniref:Uncharacterized protein n=1 Tax=Solanum bulbocastanum TaxID=147425 RepID=A0AAN8YA41_SOLBU